MKFNGDSQSRFGGVQGVSSGSRFGLRGTEDLGDGLRAVFTLEGGLPATMNGKLAARTAAYWGRQARRRACRQRFYAAASNSSRQTNLASKYFGSIDPFSISYNTANMGTTFGSANTMRLDNMVLYQTPSMGGFKAGVGYSFSADGPILDSNEGMITRWCCSHQGESSLNLSNT